MNIRTLLIGGLLPVLPGCFSYTMPLVPINASVVDAKRGQDCRVLIFGVGGHGPDVIMAQALRLGNITKVRSVEYRVSTVQGTGTRRVVAHGE